MAYNSTKHPFHNGNEAKFLKSLKRGVVYSRAQAQHIFKLKNPSAALIRFGEQGEYVYRSYVYDAKSKTYKVRYFM
jgi:hypothetical protein